MLINEGTAHKDNDEPSTALFAYKHIDMELQGANETDVKKVQAKGGWSNRVTEK
jgi:hypothetical protein